MSERKLTKLQAAALGVEWKPAEEQVEKVSNMIEDIINNSSNEEPTLNTNITNTNLMKMRKTELLKMAVAMNCNVTRKNTKRQIVTAIEKQSA